MSLQITNLILGLTNQERAKAGLKPLKLNNKLTQAAEKHSASMAEDDFFSHTGVHGSSVGDRVTNSGYQYSIVGENIAAGYRTAEQVVEGWMNSPGHRANILNSNYTEIGIGYEYLKNDTGSVNYNHYWTQVFGKSLNNNSGNHNNQSNTNNNIIFGTWKNDKIVGNSNDNDIRGRAGKDYLVGKAGDDILRGAKGADTLLGGAGNDKLLGGTDDDFLDGASGSNILVGGKGSDTFILRDGATNKIRDFQLGMDTIGLADNIDFDDLEINGKNNSSLFYKGQKIAVVVGITPDSLTGENFSDF